MEGNSFTLPIKIDIVSSYIRTIGMLGLELLLYHFFDVQSSFSTMSYKL